MCICDWFVCSYLVGHRGVRREKLTKCIQRPRRRQTHNMTYMVHDIGEKGRNRSRVCVCVRACVRARVRVRVCARVCVCYVVLMRVCVHVREVVMQKSVSSVVSLSLSVVSNSHNLNWMCIIWIKADSKIDR